MTEQNTVDPYYARCAAFVESVREIFGHGYGEGDIEHMLSIFKARNLWFVKHNNDNAKLAAETDAAIAAMTAGNDSKLVRAAVEVEEWWLERGSFHFDHTPPSIRALQSALSKIDAALKEQP